MTESRRTNRTERERFGERKLKLNKDTSLEKPAQKKCAGFSRTIGNTTYVVSCYHSENAKEDVETKVKRMIRAESESA